MTEHFDPVEFGKAVATAIREALAPIERRLADVEARKAEKGEKGDPGLPAPEVDCQAIADTVLRALLDSPRLETLADLKAVDAVAAHFRDHPVEHGRDGERGPRGEKGDPGQDGCNGRDGLDVRDMLRSRDDHLIAVMSDGTTRDLGLFVGKDGENGKDGVDGLSMADITREYDPDAHEIVERWTVGGRAEELRYPAGGIRPGGFWSDGKKALACQAFTHDGALWIAKRDTMSKPSIDNKDDWQLAARKGRDGKDGRNGIDKTAPVQVVP